jgi:hypothetical protein
MKGWRRVTVVGDQCAIKKKKLFLRQGGINMFNCSQNDLVENEQ